MLEQIVSLTLLQKHEKWAIVSIPSVLLQKPCHSPPPFSADPGLTGGLTPRPSAKKEPASNVPPSNLPPFCPCSSPHARLPLRKPTQNSLPLLCYLPPTGVFQVAPLQPSAPQAPNTRVPIFPSFPLQMFMDKPCLAFRVLPLPIKSLYEGNIHSFMYYACFPAVAE